MDQDQSHHGAQSEKGPQQPAPPLYPVQQVAHQQPAYYQQPGFGHGTVPPPPPGGVITTTVVPQSRSWMSNGASVAGVVVAGRCLIGFVTSGVFLIVTAIIMYANARDYEITWSNHSYSRSTNPLRIVAPIFLVIGIVFVLVGLIGIFVAVRAAKRYHEESSVTTSTVIRPGPVMSGNATNMYGQQNQGYYGGPTYPGQYYPPGPSGAYPPQGPSQPPTSHQAPSDAEAPPPYQPQIESVPQQRY